MIDTSKDKDDLISHIDSAIKIMNRLESNPSKMTDAEYAAVIAMEVLRRELEGPGPRWAGHWRSQVLEGLT